MPADKIILLTADMSKLEPVRETMSENLYLEISENTVGMIMHKDATKTPQRRTQSCSYAKIFAFHQMRL